MSTSLVVSRSDDALQNFSVLLWTSLPRPPFPRMLTGTILLPFSHQGFPFVKFSAARLFFLAVEFFFWYDVSVSLFQFLRHCSPFAKT